MIHPITSPATLPALPALGLLLACAGVAAHFRHARDRARRSRLLTLRALTETIDAGDPATLGHSYRIARMSVRIGRALELLPDELEALEAAALLHDIGRAAIRREIFSKPGALAPAERTALTDHPRIGAEMARAMGFDADVAAIVLAHHEQPDGLGYPSGLKDAQVPRGSRVLMAVAAFDAMTCDRPYRRGLTPEAAIDELLKHSGTQFYADVVECLVRLYTSGELFEEFEESHLERYREGQANSRAVEAFLERREQRQREEQSRRDALRAQVEWAAAAEVAAARARASRTAAPEIGGGAPLELANAPARAVPVRRIRLGGRKKSRLEVHVAALSDVGCRRENNEDSFGIYERGAPAPGCLLVVADGMGGMAAGEVASGLAVETVEMIYAAPPSGNGLAADIALALRAANEVIFARASVDASLVGMGTTCTAVGLSGRELHLAHVGDSRAYRIRGERIEQLTQDHSLAAQLVSMGGAPGGPGGAKNVLTRSLGVQADVEVDVSEGPLTLERGDRLVLCSDGLSNTVDVDEILDIVAQCAAPDEACRELVELSRARGAPDNVTVVVAAVREG